MKAAFCLLAGLGLAAGSAAKVRVPEYTRQVLPNGVVVYLMPRREVPLVTLLALVRGGAESDPPNLAGLSSVTAELLRRGTKSRTADQFSDAVEFIGGRLRTVSDEQSTSVSIELLAANVDQGIDLFADAILRASFPEPEVNKVLAQRIDAAKAGKDIPGEAIGPYFRSFFYGPEHPYGHAIGGDELSLARMGRKQIVEYHSRTYAGKNLILVAAGDFDPLTVGALLTEAFGSLPAGSAYEWKKDTPPSHQAPRLLLVDKPDSTQTHFMIGQPGIHRKHPDRVPLWLVNTLFGGRFTSMLNDALRVNSGLTYGARSHLEQNRLTGGVIITTYTPTATTEKAIDMALDIQKNLHENGISEEQLVSAKAYLKGIYPTVRLETASQLAQLLGEIELYGLDRAEVDNLFERIDAVTLKEANEAAKKYYNAQPLSFVLLGNASKIKETAGKYAPKIVEIPITKPGYR